MTRIVPAAVAVALSASAAVAQPYGPRPGAYPSVDPRGPYGFFLGDGNNTGGGGPALIVPRGPTGADTIFHSSAVGGNTSRPELAIPNGSAGGGGGNR